MGAILQFAYECSKTPMIWTTGIALVNTVLLVGAPQFPPTVLGAGNAFVAAIATVWTAQEVRLQRKEKELRAANMKVAHYEAQLAQH